MQSLEVQLVRVETVEQVNRKLEKKRKKTIDTIFVPQ